MSESASVSIGMAAALYGLAPSTVRWWEAQGVLPEPARSGGRRVYDEVELRRIGLAYLCCVVGVMPLAHAAVVTSGRRNDRWQETVRDHGRLLGNKIEQLRDAHAYLMHLLECPDDDIVDQCPWLDGELVSHTPRGRVAAESLVAAARSIAAPSHLSDQRDETAIECDETDPPLGRCVVCASVLVQAETGRRRRFCSRACRQRHYRKTASRRSAP